MRSAEVAARKAVQPSPYHTVVSTLELSTTQKGMIGEHAVMFRLAVRGIYSFSNPDPSSPVDVLTLHEGRTCGIQVKTIFNEDKNGGGISLHRRTSPKHLFRYAPGAFDFIVAYSLLRDTCYVYSEAETSRNSTSISMSRDMAEAWDKAVMRILGTEPQSE